jgi:hypothetical protein
MSARFYRNPDGDMALRAVCLVRLLAKERPERSPRGPAKQGSGSDGDVKIAPRSCWGVCIPLRGRIFLWTRLLRPTRSYHSRRRLSRIPPPQSHRRASGDLFRASLESAKL